MEANEGDTENQIAASGSLNRSITTRRTRYNNINIIMDDKDQENVISSKQETDNTEQTHTEELARKASSNKMETNKNQLTPTTNSNSSTPRRKKDPLANLHSNLSPKYIGFTTPPTQLDISNNSEEKSRSLRRRHHNMSSTNDTSINKDANMSTGSPFTPNNDTTVGYVRRTPRSKDSLATPDGKSTKRKDFVSPIDKLLIKNGSMVENNMLPLEDEIFKRINRKNNEEKEMEVEEGLDNLPDNSLREKLEEKVTEVIGELEKNSSNQETLSNDETEKLTLVRNRTKTRLSLKKNLTSPKLKSENGVIDDKLVLKNNKSEISLKPNEETKDSLNKEEIEDSLSKEDLIDSLNKEDLKDSLNKEDFKDSLYSNGTQSVANFDENSNDTKIKSKYHKNTKKTEISRNYKENSDKTEISANHKEKSDKTEVSLEDEVSLNHKEIPDKIEVVLNGENSNETNINFNVEEIDTEVSKKHKKDSEEGKVTSNDKENFAKTEVSSNHDNDTEISKENSSELSPKDKLLKANDSSHNHNIESEMKSNQKEYSEESAVKPNPKDKESEKSSNPEEFSDASEVISNLHKASKSFNNRDDNDSELASNHEGDSKKNRVKSNFKNKPHETISSSNNHDETVSEMSSNQVEDLEENEVKSNRKDKLRKANSSFNNHDDIAPEMSSNQEEDLVDKANSSSNTHKKIESEVSSNNQKVQEESEAKSEHKDNQDKANISFNHEDNESKVSSNHKENSEKSEIKSNLRDEIDKANISFNNHKDFESETSTNSSNHKEIPDKNEVSSNDDIEDIESDDLEDNIVKLSDKTEISSDEEDIEMEIFSNHQKIFESRDINSNHNEKSNGNEDIANQKENSNIPKVVTNHKESSEESEDKSNHNVNLNKAEVVIKNKDPSEESEVNSILNDDNNTEVNSSLIDDDDETEVRTNQDDLEFLSIHDDDDDEQVFVPTQNDAKQLNEDNLKTVANHEDENKTKISVINESIIIIESPVAASSAEQIATSSSSSSVKIEVDSIETESNTEFVDASSSAKSPSAVSMDSAKGSSIGNEDAWMSFSTGDLYWGQVYTFCYWPCLVCPDPDGKTITTEVHPRSGDQHIMVHVRFFADNGRRNWIKRENLLPYTGLENYQERLDEAKEKYGAKSYKLKLYIPTKKKEAVWREAVKEANEVAEIPYADRLEKFYEIFEKSKANKLKQQRRKSMFISSHRGSTSDIESFYGSNDHINNLPIPSIKRERSISPYSPAYSPIKAVKRRKLSEEQQELPTTSAAAAAASSNYCMAKSEDQQQQRNELNLSQTSSVGSSSVPSLSDLDIFNNLEFKGLYLIMKDYCLKQNHHDKLEKSLLAAARNFYAIKQLSEQIEQRRLRESLTDNDLSTSLTKHQTEGADGSLKRLSTRLRTLKRKSQQSQFVTPDRSVVPAKHVKENSSSVDKSRKSLEPLNRPILEVIGDIFDLDNKYLFKSMSRDPVCKYCFKPGGNLKRCDKNCGYWLHSECLHIDFSKNGKGKRAVKRVSSTKSNNDMDTSMSVMDTTSEDLNEKTSVPHVTGDTEGEVICKECTNKEPVKCMVCKLTESAKDDDPLVKCTMPHCDRAFHPACCKYWPQAKITISKNHIESFRCPSHVCHTCVSDDPKGKFQHLTSGKITKCVKCPATYHTDSTCIPAGSQILTAAYIICPRHTNTRHDMTVNVNWCFICVGGGQVVCCETCPTAVHAQCLKIPIDPNEGYICEECESGRMPLYGEMVWAKFNSFRWWPAIILPPTEIPKNIARKTHNPSDFVVRFFGTHDHGWISRRRVYLYLEGDSSEPPKSKSHMDLHYKRGVEEAKEVYEIIKAKKLQQSGTNESKEKLHPQPYVRIKANRAVPPVKLHIDIDSVSICECDPKDENPCGPDTNCLNRVLYHECNPKVCPAGERCQNQMFESRISPRLDVIYMKERGFGLVCREPIAMGTFVIEYVGEIINDNEFQARMQQKSRDRDENFYFLSVEKDYIIDAGPKGNLARFMNHSCDPNCETQKWQVNSLNRVGLFAIKDIPENTELTFNYHWDDLLGNEKKTCFCGAKRCAGQIGAKLKDIEPKEPATSSTAKNKSKTKTKPVKRLHKGLKGKPGPKLKLNSNKNTKTKKMAAVAAVSASLKAKNKSTSPTTIEDALDDDSPTSSNKLESPDLIR